MNKDRFEELINTVETGNASPEEVRECEDALARNPELVQYESFVADLKATARSYPRVSPSEGFASKVAAAAKANNRSSRIEEFHTKKFTLRSVFVDFAPRSRVFAIAVAVHACILLILAFVFLEPNKSSELPTMISIAGQPADLVAQRSTAPRFSTNIADDSGIDVSQIVKEGSLYVLRLGISSHRVLVAYDETQVKALDPGIAEQAFPALVVKGRIRLSNELIEAGLGLKPKGEVVLLAMTDRIEIWNASDFNCYIGGTKNGHVAVAPVGL